MLLQRLRSRESSQNICGITRSSEKLTIKEGGNVKQYGFSMLNYGWFFEELLATQGALYVDNEN